MLDGTVINVSMNTECCLRLAPNYYMYDTMDIPKLSIRTGLSRDTVRKRLIKHGIRNASDYYTNEDLDIINYPLRSRINKKPKHKTITSKEYEVIRLYFGLKDNTMANLSKITGIKEYRVNTIVKSFLSGDELVFESKINNP